MSKKENARSAEVGTQEPDGGRELRPIIPSEVRSVFDERPLIMGEDVEAYEDLLARVTVEVKPTGIIEWLWVKDVVDLLWESRRLRRLKAALLHVAREKALTSILRPIFGKDMLLQDPAAEVARGWTAGEASARKQVDKLLRENGLNFDAVMAQALSNKLDDVERIDRMITAADLRRDKVLREIENRRDTLALRLRHVSEEIVGVEGGAQGT